MKNTSSGPEHLMAQLIHTNAYLEKRKQNCYDFPVIISISGLVHSVKDKSHSFLYCMCTCTTKAPENDSF